MAFSQSFVFNGLGTFSFTAPEAGAFTVNGKITLPTLSGGATANSEIVVTVEVDSSLVYTGVAGAEGFTCGIAPSAGDVVEIILTSAAAVDQGLNKIKTTVAIF